MSELLKQKKNFLFFIFVVTCLFIFFVWNSKIAWAEVIAEFMPYVNANNITQSFAGYITVFPIAMASFYGHIIKQFGIGYVNFMNFVSFVYTIMCFFAIAEALKNERFLIKLISIVVIFSSILHPSVYAIINITHLGYLPIVLYILSCLKKDNIKECLLEMPYFLFVPLVIALISKPSLAFLLFIIVLPVLYKNKAKFFILVFICLITVLQIYLFKNGNNRFVISNFKAIIKFSFCFVHSIGCCVLFSIYNYRSSYNSVSQVEFVGVNSLFSV